MLIVLGVVAWVIGSFTVASVIGRAIKIADHKEDIDSDAVR